jgi:transcriptional regulator of acetoin/glycerol metabolism
MLPTAYPYDRQALLERWKQFVNEGTCDVATLDPAVARSWRRCRETALSPLGFRPVQRCETPEALDQRVQAHFDLIAIARPFMEGIYQFVGEQNVVVYLTDRELCLLNATGDEKLMRTLTSAGLDEGVFMTEDAIGTNSAALAVIEGVPVQVVGPEHYVADSQCLTGSAAPIHSPLGELLSVLGIITLERDGHPHTLGIAMAAAKAIENQLQADLSLAEANRHLEQAAELDLALEAMNKGILLLDEQRRVTHINAHASDILGISRRFAMGRTIDSLLSLPPQLQDAMTQQTPLVDREIVFETQDGPRPCLVSMEVLWRGSSPRGFGLRLDRAAEVRQLVHRMVGARAHFTFADIVYQDVEMRWTVHYARKTAQEDANVLLLGESGTGKEMFAQAIHNASRRASGPFIAINCAAIPRELMAIELFGYERSFPGASDDGRPGKFELADGGTIFLDNVEGLPLDMQASLLGVIDTREVTRLGGSSATAVDVRIVASSSHVDLASEVQQGRLRADLFYRLHVLTVSIPALRERGNDVLLLVAHLMQKFDRRSNKPVTVSPGALEVLQSYPWPGNVRELENVLERAIHMVEGGELTVEHLPGELYTVGAARVGERMVTLQEAERQAIIRAGRVLHGNTTRMAEVLGIGRTTLWRKMRAFKVSPESFKG